MNMKLKLRFSWMTKTTCEIFEPCAVAFANAFTLRVGGTGDGAVPALGAHADSNTSKRLLSRGARIGTVTAHFVLRARARTLPKSVLLNEQAPGRRPSELFGRALGPNAARGPRVSARRHRAHEEVQCIDSRSEVPCEGFDSIVID